MKLSDVQKRLQAPFPVKEVNWKPASFTRDRSRALLLAHIDARAVQDRLDAVCPDAWSFEMEVVSAAGRPTIKGRLTVLGVVREDIGEARGVASSRASVHDEGGVASPGASVHDEGGDLGTFKAAASDALKRCAVQFGIGRYLYDLPKSWADWDDAKRAPTQTPELPQWARPDHERSPGGAHLISAIDQLKYELPDDLELQRELYKHLKAALGSLHPAGKAA